MSREIRQVPKNWSVDKHEQNDYGNPDGMFSMEDWDYFMECYQEDLQSFKSDPEKFDYEEPQKPNKKDFIPLGDYYQLFQTVSEGTPISPTFKTVEELVEHLRKVGDDNGEQWSDKSLQYLLEGALIPSGVIEDIGLNNEIRKGSNL